MTQGQDLEQARAKSRQVLDLIAKKELNEAERELMRGVERIGGAFQKWRISPEENQKYIAKGLPPPGQSHIIVYLSRRPITDENLGQLPYLELVNELNLFRTQVKAK